MSEINLNADTMELQRQNQELLNKCLDDAEKELKSLNNQVYQTAGGFDFLKRNIESVKQKLDETGGEIQEFIGTGSDMEKISEELGDIGEAAAESGDSVGKIGEEISRLGDDSKIRKITKIGEQFETLSDSVKKAGGYLQDLAEEYGGATQKVSAYFGETGEQAEVTASVIEGIWADGVGSSIEQVSNAVITVKENLRDLDSQTLTNLTEQVITLSELYGIDMDKTLRSVDTLMIQFGIDAQTAMDYIVVGTQNGLDKTDELGVNIVSYADKFAKAGYSAEEYFQLLNNGLASGTGNFAKVHDAITTVMTNLSDGTIERSIGQYSEKTQELFEAWKNGGVSQKGVINAIVNDISTAKDDQEKLTLAAVAFGAVGQESNHSFLASLNTVGVTYDEVTGKAAALYEQTTTPQQELNASMRELQMELVPVAQQLMSLAVEILPLIIGVVAKIADFVSSNPWLTNIIIAVGVLVGVLGTLAPIISAIATVVAGFGTGVLLPAVGIIAMAITIITTLIAVIQNWGAITEWIGILFSTVFESIKTAVSNVVESVSTTLTDKINMWKELLLNIAVGLLEWLYSLGAMALTAIINGLENMVNTIKSFLALISAVWIYAAQAIITTVSNAVNNIMGAFINMMTNLYNHIQSGLETIKKLWESLRTFLLELAVIIVEKVCEAFQTLCTKCVEFFNNLKNGIAEKISGVKDTIITGIGEAVDWLMNLPGRAFEWGADLIDGFIDGIRSMLDSLKNIVVDVAESVSDFLHFSRPEKGPLHNYEEWMPDMMQGLAQGIKANRYLVKEQILGLTGDMAMVLQGNNQQSKPVNLTSYNVFTIDGKQVAEVVNQQLGVLL